MGFACNSVSDSLTPHKKKHNSNCLAYVDYNSNEELDGGEPSALTNTAGAFNISLSPAMVRSGFQARLQLLNLSSREQTNRPFDERSPWRTTPGNGGSAVRARNSTYPLTLRVQHTLAHPDFDPACKAAQATASINVSVVVQAR